MGWRKCFALAVLVPVAQLEAYAQVSIEPRSVNARHAAVQPAPPKGNLRVDSDLVLVPVSVCDPHNRPVTGLEKDHFQVFDNQVEQTVTHFAMDDQPLAVGLVFDTSGSMGAKLRKSRLAASAFFKTANPEDEFFLVEFNDTPKVAVPLTADPEEIQNRLTFTQSHGRTALLDAIVLALHEMKKSDKNRKALLVISDGGDNCSRYTETELRNLVRESDVLIYSIGIFEPYGTPAASPEELVGPSLLSDISEQTGGREFPVGDLSELPDIAARIGIELRNRYVLGYSPIGLHRDGRYHRVHVKIIPPRGLPPLHAYWRLGYYAPAQ